MTLIIEKGVPLPPDRNNRGPLGRASACEWGKLEVGDSTLVKSESSRCAALQWAPRNGVVFTSRKVPHQGWRIWRLA